MSRANCGSYFLAQLECDLFETSYTVSPFGNGVNSHVSHRSFRASFERAAAKRLQGR